MNSSNSYKVIINYLSKLTLLIFCFNLSPADAFGEDVCWNQDLNIEHCLPLPENCLPGDESTACQIAMIKIQTNAWNAYINGTSSVHLEATYYLAMLLGFTQHESLIIAIYNQAVDSGDFVPYTRQGKELAVFNECFYAPELSEWCRYTTPPLNGLDRFAEETAGTLAHFPILNNPNMEPINGLKPDLSLTQEQTLNDWHKWAFDIKPKACVLGLNHSEFNMIFQDLCYVDENNPGPLPAKVYGVYIPYPIFESIEILIDSPVTQQILHQSAEHGTIYSDQLEQLLLAHDDLPFAKLGIYLHTLQDRISHHNCLDVTTYRSVISDRYREIFEIDFDSDGCSYALHYLWHAWEIGVNFDSLPEKNKTVEPALYETIATLQEYREHHHLPLINISSEQADEIVNFMLNIFKLTDAAERQEQWMIAMAEQYQLPPIPWYLIEE